MHATLRPTVATPPHARPARGVLRPAVTHAGHASRPPRRPLEATPGGQWVEAAGEEPSRCGQQMGRSRRGGRRRGRGEGGPAAPISRPPARPAARTAGRRGPPRCAARRAAKAFMMNRRKSTRSPGVEVKAAPHRRTPGGLSCCSAAERIVTRVSGRGRERDRERERERGIVWEAQCSSAGVDGAVQCCVGLRD